MNLLVKKIGLVILPALFFACEDPTELGAPINPNQGAISTHYIEIPVNTSHVKNDSILSSSQRAQLTTSFLGSIRSTAFGVTNASLYTNIGLPTGFANGFQAHDVFDYAELRLVIRSNVYGKAINSNQTFDLYQLTEPISSTASQTIADTLELLSYRYYAKDQEPLGNSLGQFNFALPEKFTKDTVVTVRLDPAQSPQFAQLFEALKNNSGSVRESQQAFDDFIKGLAIVPGENNSVLMQLKIWEPGNSNVSGIDLHFNRGTDHYAVRLPFYPKSLNLDTDRLDYAQLPTYFSLETNREGTGLVNAPLTPHLATFESTDDRVYLQRLGGILPKLEFKSFIDFMGTLENDEHIVLNRALLEFDSLVAEDPKMPVLPGATLYMVGNDNKLFQSSINTGAEQAVTTLVRTRREGSKDITFVQTDLAYTLDRFRQTGDERYLQAMLYPDEAYFNMPHQFVVRANQVKLKIWYTKLKGANL